MKASIKIHWVSTNPGASPDDRGYWESSEGRFEISPNYRHTVYPDSYTILDRLSRGTDAPKTSFDRVRDCKDWALARCESERGLRDIIPSSPEL